MLQSVIFWRPFKFEKGFPDSSVGKESTCSTGDPSSIPGSGRSAGEGIGYQLQNSVLEDSMDCIVHGVEKSQTQLNDFHFDFRTLCLMDVPIYIPTKSAGTFSSLRILCNMFVGDSLRWPSDRREVIAHWTFDLPSSNT